VKRFRTHLRAGFGGFSPLTLFASGSQGAWYDPADFSTLFQDSAGTTPVTATGQPVGKILDKSGRGNHATQATATVRPLLQQDASGYYYLSFDGVDDWLATGNVDLSAAGQVSTFAGLLCSNTAAGAIGMVINQGGTGFNSFSVQVPTATSGQIAAQIFGSTGSASASESGLAASFPPFCRRLAISPRRV
jgi:hypothetical protein